MAHIAAKALSISHTLVGLSAVIAPFLTQATFRLNPAPSSAFIGRLFGSRDILMGAAVWFARPGDELRRTLFIVNAINTIDVVSSLVCLWEGNLSVEGAALGGGGAAVLLTLGLVGLRSAGGHEVLS